ncbi:MAG TPA: MFS transporter [Bacilli bacterium]|nr:MFS transporter [Bacilli bacterium]
MSLQAKFLEVSHPWKQVLHHPHLPKFAMARSTSRIATNLIPIIISWQILHELHATLWLTLYFTWFTVGLAVGSFGGGLYVDTSGPRKVLLVSDAVRTLICALAVLLLNSKFGICTLGMVLGITGGISAVASGVLPRKLLTDELLHIGVSFMSTIGQALFLIIPLIGTSALKLMSSSQIWALIALLYGVSTFQFLRIPDVGLTNRSSKFSLDFSLKSSFSALIKDPHLYMFAVLSIVTALTTTGILDVMVPYVLVNWAQSAAGTFGLTMPLWGVGLMIGSILSGFLKPKSFMTLVWTHLLLAIGFLLVVQSSSLLIGIGLAVIGLFTGYLRAITTTLLSLLVPEQILGRASGLLDTLDLILQPVSLWGAEFAITRKAIMPFIAVCEIIVILGILISLAIGFGSKKVKQAASSVITRS